MNLLLFKNVSSSITKQKKTSLRNDGSKTAGRGMSADQLNKKIALDFLSDLKQRKNENPDEEMEIQEHSRVTFQKPKGHESETLSTPNAFGTSHSGKARVMKTYEIGQKVSNKNKKLDITKEKHVIPEKVIVDLPFDESIGDKDNDNSDGNDLVQKNEIPATFVNKKKNNRRNIRRKETLDDTD